MININFRTHYSLESLIKPDSVYGQYMGIADYKSMGGIVQFYKACKENDIIPIIGYSDQEIFLAANKLQYKELLNAFSYNSIPKTICVVGAPFLGLWNLIQTKSFSPQFCEDAYNVAKSYILDLATKVDCIFLAQSNRTELCYAAQNELLKDLAAELNLPLVPVPEFYYGKTEDKDDHKIYIANKTKVKPREYERLEDRYKRFYLEGDYSVSEWDETFDLQKLLDRIEPYDILAVPKLPRFSDNDDELFKEKLREGWRLLISKISDKKSYEDRIKREISVLTDAGLSSYFLIVADLMMNCKHNGWLTGPGRGCLCNSNVYMSNGTVKDISEVQTGDLVISESGNARRVLNTFKYSCNEDLVNVKVYCGETNGITMTKDHKVLCVENGRKVWKNAEYLSKNDWLFFPTPKLAEVDISIDVENHLYDISKCLQCTVLDDSIRINKKGNVYSKKSYSHTPKNIVIDDDLCYTAGYFSGNGWLDHTSLVLATHIIKTERLERVKDFLTKIGCYITDKKTVGNVIKTYCTNKIVYNIFSSLFCNYSSNATTKHIPKEILSNKKYLKPFLEGLMATDGSKKTRTLTNSISTSSKNLAYQSKFALACLGVPCSVVELSRKITSYGNISQSYQLDFSRVAYEKENWKSNFTKKMEDGFALKIRSIDVAKSNFVYDIEIEDESNYLTTSGIVHNSAIGCLSSYLMGITRIDPISYGLFFERFYNESRFIPKHISFDEKPYQ